MPQLTDEEQLYRNLRDFRVLKLDLAQVVEEELSSSRTLQAIIEAIAEDSNTAMLEFANVNPADTIKVSALQARVFCLTYLRQTINQIRLDAEAAVAALNEESAHLMEEHDYYE